MHPVDGKAMEKMVDQEIGELQAHLSITNMILGQCLTERLMMTRHDLADSKAEHEETKEMLACQRELAIRYQQESTSLRSIIKRQHSDHGLEIEHLKAKNATTNEELKKAKAEVERIQQMQKESEQRFIAEKAADIKQSDAMKARIAELENAIAQLSTKGLDRVENKKEWIDKYKTTDEYQYELKDVGSYGFNLLRRVLKKQEKLPAADLNAYDYDSCILEDAMGNVSQ